MKNAGMRGGDKTKKDNRRLVQVKLREKRRQRMN